MTNQPDIARGKQTRDEVDRMHDVLRARLPLDEIVVCAHDDADDCPCRKPRPGMILDAAARLDLDLAESVCVGDRWRDVGPAKRAGVTAIFVDRGYGERRPTEPTPSWRACPTPSKSLSPNVLKGGPPYE